jgi:hypothetical protein
MNALLILKTTKATCGRIVTNTELAFKTKKEKRELINANNELIFKVKKSKTRSRINCCQRKAELYLDMAGSAFVSLDEKVMSL